jgi:methylcytosine dioxygenase TET2/3
MSFTGYPRVNSVPPRSLNCNGYPGLNEYGGNSINTTANTQTVTNTSSSQTTQMQPPLPQSPSRQQPSRPNSSHMMYQQQSPSHYNNNNLHMSPTSQAQSPSSHSNGGSTTPNMNQQYQQQLTPTSHHQAEDWNRNWNGNPQAVENFNQADRINLNTRLKTMILNKNEKDQQQTSTGHFLSYSHQHLPEQQQPLANDINLSNKSNNNGTKLTEAGDDGGFKMNDAWKSSVMKQEIEENKSKDFFEQKQQLSEETMGDPGGTKETKEVKNSTEGESEGKVIDQGSNQFGFGDLHNNVPKSEKTSESERDRQSSYSYHSAHEYQQHQNMVNNIKKEPNGEDGNVKFEGYEKNYQNFIRYADFCDAQQPQYEGQKQTQYQQDYMQSQGYYNNYPYQNYTQPHSQNYQQFMSQQAAYQQHGHHHPSSLTNFEQQIPLHTYPIPKHTTSKNGETPLPLTSIKNESMPSNPLHPYPFLGENVAGMNKDSVAHYPRNLGGPGENPCDIMTPKEEVSSTQSNKASK